MWPQLCVISRTSYSWWGLTITYTLLKHGCNDSTFLGCSVACLKIAPQGVDEEVFVQHQRVLHNTSGSVTLALMQPCNTSGSCNSTFKVLRIYLLSVGTIPPPGTPQAIRVTTTLVKCQCDTTTSYTSNS